MFLRGQWIHYHRLPISTRVGHLWSVWGHDLSEKATWSNSNFIYLNLSWKLLTEEATQPSTATTSAVAWLQ